MGHKAYLGVTLNNTDLCYPRVTQGDRMPTKKLTQLTVDRIAIPKAGRVETWDSQLPGFGLRVAASGHKSWVAMYRVGGKLQRFTIGTVDQYPKVETARERARQVMHDARAGIDPAAVKKAARVAKAIEASEDANTVRAVAARFVELYCRPNNRSWREAERTLNNHVVARWGDRPMASITTADVFQLLDSLVIGGHKIAANRVLAAMRKMCAWAVERQIIASSPAKGISAPSEETERDRVLTDDELLRVWRAAEIIGGMAGPFVQTLILLAQRRDETAGMRWSDLDLQSAIWTIPSKTTKAGRTHLVPLPGPAVEILRRLPRLGDCEFVFTTDSKHPISGYSKIKDRIEGLAKIERLLPDGVRQNDWRFHDLRRTAATGMGDLGIAGSIISKILNHKEGGITKIYNRSEQLPERRHALETWARHVQSLVEPSGGNVVELREAV